MPIQEFEILQTSTPLHAKKCKAIVRAIKNWEQQIISLLLNEIQTHKTVQRLHKYLTELASLEKYVPK